MEGNEKKVPTPKILWIRFSSLNSWNILPMRYSNKNTKTNWYLQNWRIEKLSIYKELSMSKQNSKLKNIFQIKTIFALLKCFSNKKYNCCGPLAFKSQRYRYQSKQKIIASLPAFYHYQDFQQKIFSIHKFILKIQQILGSHELKGYGHAHPNSAE